MGEPAPKDRTEPSLTGIPPGMVTAVVAILHSVPGPIRRRKLLEELDHRGRRISLAGLNRVLQHCSQNGITLEGPDGVRLKDPRR